MEPTDPDDLGVDLSPHGEGLFCLSLVVGGWVMHVDARCSVGASDGDHDAVAPCRVRSETNQAPLRALDQAFPCQTRLSIHPTVRLAPCSSHPQQTGRAGGIGEETPALPEKGLEHGWGGLVAMASISCSLHARTPSPPEEIFFTTLLFIFLPETCLALLFHFFLAYCLLTGRRVDGRSACRSS